MTATTERILGAYQLHREVGRGGMATVYQATDTRNNQTVAVKVLHAVTEMSPDEWQRQRTRLRREAEAVSRLKHPNIVAMHEVIFADETENGPAGEHYLVMEFVAGETLRQRVRRGGPLGPHQAVGVLEQVASALDTVHAAGIIHRDIKPSNIMVLPDGTAKLMDFGVARLQDDTKVTRTGMVIGSPAFMSPEQATGANITPASDVWALTAVFYEMLTGQAAFRGENIPAVLFQITHGQPAPLPVPESSEDQPLVARLQTVFTRAFQRDPAMRFASAGELAAAFRSALEERPEPVRKVALPALPPLPPMPPRPVWIRGASFALIPFAILLLSWGIVRGRGNRSPVAPVPTAVTSGTATINSPVTVNDTKQTPDSRVLASRSVPPATPAPNERKPSVLSSASVAVSTPKTSAKTNAAVKVKVAGSKTVPVRKATTGKTTAPKPVPVKSTSKAAVAKKPAQPAPKPKPKPKPTASTAKIKKPKPEVRKSRGRRTTPPGWSKRSSKSRGRGSGKGNGRGNSGSPPFSGKTVLRPRG